MPSTKKRTAGQRPDASQRDEGGRSVTPEEQQLGNTQRDQRRDPKLPHERDESTSDDRSANAATQADKEVMRRAHDDVASGRQDTDRGPVMDETYHALRKKK